VSAERPDEPSGTEAGPDVAREALARARAAARGRRPPARSRRADGPPPPTGPGVDPRDPQPLGMAVRQLVNDRSWDATVASATVLGRWTEIVGEELAAHCQPESLADGRLVLVAESTAWATQVRLLARSVLARIAAAVGDGVVGSMQVHGPTAPDWRHGPRRVGGGRGPRDTYG